MASPAAAAQSASPWLHPILAMLSMIAPESVGPSAQGRGAERRGERVDLVDQVRRQGDAVTEPLLAALGLEHPRHHDPFGAGGGLGAAHVVDQLVGAPA